MYYSASGKSLKLYDRLTELANGDSRIVDYVWLHTPENYKTIPAYGLIRRTFMRLAGKKVPMVKVGDGIPLEKLIFGVIRKRDNIPDDQNIVLSERDRVIIKRIVDEKDVPESFYRRNPDVV